MEQLLDFENSKFKNKVYKLNKVLYGLKQASKSWYEKIDQYVQSQTLKHSNYYYNLYYLVENNKIVILTIYVDDFL
jgi:phage-related protein